MLDVELSITSGLGKTTRRENVVKNDIMEKFEEEPVHDEAFATRIKQEVVLLATQAEKDHVSKLSRPVWPKSSPTIPSSLFKNDFQTQVFSQFVLIKVPMVAGQLFIIDTKNVFGLTEIFI